MTDLRENYVSSNRSAYVHENFSQVELEEMRKAIVRNYERWYYNYPQRLRRMIERVSTTRRTRSSPANAWDACSESSRLRAARTS